MEKEKEIEMRNKFFHTNDFIERLQFSNMRKERKKRKEHRNDDKGNFYKLCLNRLLQVEKRHSPKFSKNYLLNSPTDRVLQGFFKIAYYLLKTGLQIKLPCQENKVGVKH